MKILVYLIDRLIHAQSDIANQLLFSKKREILISHLLIFVMIMPYIFHDYGFGFVHHMLFEFLEITELLLRSSFYNILIDSNDVILIITILKYFIFQELNKF